MTDPQNPFGDNPFTDNPYTYDPLGRVPLPPPSPPPPPIPAPPPPGYRPPVNTLATLSLVFAFVFAPVGAILGHLGLAQIRRTGELGRDRALVGVALSYSFIAFAVLALVAWATLTAFPSRQAAAPATTTTATTEAAPAPTVAPDNIVTLLPGLDALKKITSDENLQPGQTWDRPARSDTTAGIDRAQCWGSVIPGAPEAYTLNAVLRYHAAEFDDTRSFLKSTQVMQAVTAFADPPAAQSQLAKLLDGWHQCGGSTVTVTDRSGPSYPLSLSAPADAGNGITTMDLVPKDLKVRFVRAVAAKSNVVVDLEVNQLGTTDADAPRQMVVSIARYILDKIPG
ncbi:sensor domain-containing protein [Mycobacterium sp. 663a-19]|uniref:sensor domain-containing protein n=1 Tax=Mycobacterium sp. 663a-19 TaxID=2986148 RepID=UPI002D1EA7F9|nr:sensor domain-containing protein [Mycobacterium sp. 663a-19]MEB3982147.1 sensor domain-containing protein [Mycobacterium sp. 663a-19]